MEKIWFWSAARIVGLDWDRNRSIRPPTELAFFRNFHGIAGILDWNCPVNVVNAVRMLWGWPSWTFLRVKGQWEVKFSKSLFRTIQTYRSMARRYFSISLGTKPKADEWSERTHSYRRLAVTNQGKSKQKFGSSGQLTCRGWYSAFPIQCVDVADGDVGNIFIQ